MSSEEINGALNPTWVEWLMGFPLGWTDLQPLETDKFQQWCELHGVCSATVDANLFAKETLMIDLDSFDRYDAQSGRRYKALETDSPERWLMFAVSHPQFNPAKHEESSYVESTN